VRGDFILLFAGFGTVAAYTATGENLDTTVRLSRLFLASANPVNAVTATRPGAAWTSERGRRFPQAASGAAIALQVLNVVLANLGHIQFLFLFQVWDPASIFSSIRDVAGGDSADHSDEGETAR